MSPRWAVNRMNQHTSIYRPATNKVPKLTHNECFVYELMRSRLMSNCWVPPSAQLTFTPFPHR